jgi:hypothetical protein
MPSWRSISPAPGLQMSKPWLPATTRSSTPISRSDYRAIATADRAHGQATSQASHHLALALGDDRTPSILTPIASAQPAQALPPFSAPACGPKRLRTSVTRFSADRSAGGLRVPEACSRCRGWHTNIRPEGSPKMRPGTLCHQPGVAALDRRVDPHRELRSRCARRDRPVESSHALAPTGCIVTTPAAPSR